MNVEAILFDMDGVLVDVSQSYRYAIKKTAEYFTEEEIQYSEIQEFKNKGGYNNDWECCHAIISAHNKNVYSWEVTDKFQEFYLGKNFDGFVLNETWLLNHHILDSLYHKYKLGIVTGDTIDDMRAATSAGITSVGLLTDDDRSQQQIDLLKSNGAIEILNSVNDVLGFLNEKHKV